MRVALKISQVELSQRIGLNEGYIGKIEQPATRKKYNVRQLNAIAIALECSPRDFLPEQPVINEKIHRLVKLVRQPKARKGEQNYEVVKKKISR